MHEVMPDIFAHVREVASSLLPDGRYVGPHHTVHDHKTHEEHRVTLINLHAVAGGPQYLGDDADHAPDTGGIEPALRVEVGGAALIDALGRLRQPPSDPFCDLVRIGVERTAHELASHVVERARNDGTHTCTSRPTLAMGTSLSLFVRDLLIAGTSYNVICLAPTVTKPIHVTT